MKAEPKTPLQLRAESIVKDDELLGATVPQADLDYETDTARFDNEEVVTEDLERKEVIPKMIKIERTIVGVFEATFKGSNPSLSWNSYEKVG